MIQSEFLSALTDLINEHAPGEEYNLLDLLDDAATVGLEGAADLYQAYVAQIADIATRN